MIVSYVYYSHNIKLTFLNIMTTVTIGILVKALSCKIKF